MHGSVTPKILVRTILVSIWLGVITAISEQVHSIKVAAIYAAAIC
jgi:hypothetical protein